MSKRYYAVYYKEEGSIWSEWKLVEKFLKENKGQKLHKGFFTISEAKYWLSELGENEPVVMCAVPERRADTSINRKARKAIMEIFRSYPSENKKSALNKILNFMREL